MLPPSGILTGCCPGVLIPKRLIGLFSFPTCTCGWSGFTVNYDYGDSEFGPTWYSANDFALPCTHPDVRGLLWHLRCNPDNTWSTSYGTTFDLPPFGAECCSVIAGFGGGSQTCDPFELVFPVQIANCSAGFTVCSCDGATGTLTIVPR